MIVRTIKYVQFIKYENTIIKTNFLLDKRRDMECIRKELK